MNRDSTSLVCRDQLSHVTVVTFIYVIIFLQTQEEVCLGMD